jgi:hypothetical protein
LHERWKAIDYLEVTPKESREHTHKILIGDRCLEWFAMSAVIDFDQRGAAVLRMLIYPIQFEADPLNGIGHVAAQVFADHSRLPLHEVIAAIDAGLTSSAKLSELIPQSHSEVVIRRFLSALRMRLEAEPGRT